MHKRRTFDAVGGGGRLLRGLIKPRRAHRRHGRLYSSRMMGKRVAVVQDSDAREVVRGPGMIRYSLAG
jgi:hypothetical protein